MITREDLSDGWTLRLADDTDISCVPAHVLAALPIPATVPGTVHTDLLAAGLIADPYLDLTELTLDWIGNVDWIYERAFPGHEKAVEDGTAVLAFDGLDTIATVTLDDTVVLESENMHRRYEIDITDAARAGATRLAVRFGSAWAFGDNARERLGDRPSAYPAPFNYLRKSACNFGWDWGPTLVTAGIWRSVRLHTGSGPRITRVSPTVTVEGATGVAMFDVTLAEPAGNAVTVTVTIEGSTTVVDIEPGQSTVSIRVLVERVELWWPQGLGAQRMYDVAIRIGNGDLPVAQDEWAERIGFRTLRLHTTPDSSGTPFIFVINGATVPIRGANWIPDDCFLPRVTESRLRRRIGQAVDANFNLLRVWGGGVYESDDFYRICDELGVLVWQDFLFACAAYPEDDRLADEVEAEARDNVQRLMPHPSLVLWNGNNENIWGWFDWHWQEALNQRSWGLGYYLELLPRVVTECDPSRPYWAGSPYSGSMELHPNHDDHALTHVWDVWNQVDYTAYRDHKPRFVSEFGWQAPPTWSTIKRSVHDEPLTPTSPGMRHHQKAEDGYGKLERGLEPHFVAPENMIDWHFAMQLNQARAIAFGIEHFRSLRPHNFGTIVWQLNDCWPGTSWAAIDGYGRKKPLWYALRAAQSPRLLTIQPTGDGLALIAVNDGGDQWREFVTVRRIAFDGTELARYMTRTVTDRFGSAKVELPDIVAVSEDVRSEMLVAETGTGTRAIWFFSEDRELNYDAPRYTTEVERVGDDVLLTVTAETLLRELCIFPDRINAEAETEDLLVTLLPGERHTFRVHNIPLGREAELMAYPVLRTANELVGQGRL